MDALSLIFAKERFLNPKSKPHEHFNEGASLSWGSWLVSTALGCLAAYLSWTCNSADGIGAGWRFIRAFFAFIFGLFYLIVYAIFFAGRCGGK
jgi:hypothetical protein